MRCGGVADQAIPRQYYSLKLRMNGWLWTYEIGLRTFEYKFPYRELGEGKSQLAFRMIKLMFTDFAYMAFP
jgi:hypothetical protein